MSLAEVFILLLFLFTFVVLSDRSRSPDTDAGEESAKTPGQDQADTMVPGETGSEGPLEEGVGEPVVPAPDESAGIYPPDAQTQTSADPSMAEGVFAATPEDNIFPAPEDSPAVPQPSPPPGDDESVETHTWPPIISLDEAKGYFFPKGRASLSEEFTERLHGPIKDELAAHIGEYETDVIEVVGHTDEQPVRGGSNLDARLLDVLGGQSSADSLSAADNVGLGMARAAAVAKVLAEALAPLVDVKVIAYSAGQTVEPGDVLSRGLDRGDSQGRRRIEIRLRRSVQSP
jgi:outer membrane protein OmpA-like peptidoglycan-associated protein